MSLSVRRRGNPVFCHPGLDPGSSIKKWIPDNSVTQNFREDKLGLDRHARLWRAHDDEIK